MFTSTLPLARIGKVLRVDVGVRPLVLAACDHLFNAAAVVDGDLERVCGHLAVRFGHEIHELVEELVAFGRSQLMKDLIAEAALARLLDDTRKVAL